MVKHMAPIISFEEWLPQYIQIASLLGLDIHQDRRATRLLNDLLGDSALTLQAIEDMLQGSPAIVFGAGPSLKKDLAAYLDTGLPRRCKVVAADGAARALKEVGVKARLLVTDLDGPSPVLQWAKNEGSILAIHGHGDNIEDLVNLVPRLKPALGTTQVEPLGCVVNLGGFTDGDRSAFLSAAGGASAIVLAAMDLEGPPGTYSSMGRRSPEKASTRLAVCRDLLELLATLVSIPLYNATSGGGSIRGFTSVPWHELSSILT